MGKGDNRRPSQVPQKTFNDNFDKIFNTKKLPDKDANNVKQINSSKHQ